MAPYYPAPAMYQQPQPIGEFTTHGGYHPTLSGTSVHGHVHQGFAANRDIPPVMYPGAFPAPAPAPVFYSPAAYGQQYAFNNQPPAVYSQPPLLAGDITSHGSFHQTHYGWTPSNHFVGGYGTSTHGHLIPGTNIVAPQ